MNELPLSPASRLMHKYNGHAATDVTGFGLKGHADTLAQASGVDLVLQNLPFLAGMRKVAALDQTLDKFLACTSPETSGL